MDQVVYGAVCFDRAAELLPREMRYAVAKLPLEQRAVAEEFRLRAGRGLSVQGPVGEYMVTNGQGLLVYQGDLRQVLEIATQASAHSALEQVKNGFFTVRNGHRIGLCGTAVVRDGEIANLKDFSSLAIRIAREVPGVCLPVIKDLMENGRFCNTLIISPPGGGKTTLLRDLIRTLSDGTYDPSVPALRVGLADERGEVAAMYSGLPQMNVGLHTDVLDGCPKAAGMLLLLRSMNPQVLAADEITAPEDCAALEMAANCGVALLATAHCADKEELERRPLYRHLLDRGIFTRLLTIRVENGVRVCSVERLEPTETVKSPQPRFLRRPERFYAENPPALEPGSAPAGEESAAAAEEAAGSKGKESTAEETKASKEAETPPSAETLSPAGEAPLSSANETVLAEGGSISVQEAAAPEGDAASSPEQANEAEEDSAGAKEDRGPCSN